MLNELNKLNDRTSLLTELVTIERWLERIQTRTARIGIIGLGYVGLPLTLLFSEERFAVTGFDIDRTKVDVLNAGTSYIHRIESEHILAARSSGFTATDDLSGIAAMDAVLICVPTPLHEDHTPDMSYVVSTMETIAPYVRPGQLVVLESTTYPGTTEEIVVETINRHGKSRGVHVLRDGNDSSHGLEGVLVAFSPEREDPGNVVVARRDIPKVIGGVNALAARAASALYATIFDRTVLMSSPAAAEMTKLLENIYRCVNIALVNELKQLCEPMNLNVWEIIDAASTKPFGFQAFYPGPGVGGHCIPVDPFYLTWKAEQFGFPTRFIALAGEVNESMPGYVVDTTTKALARNGVGLSGARVLVLGVAYKRDVDDMRESPSLAIIQRLLRAGVAVAYNDPFFEKLGKLRHYEFALESTPLSEELTELAAYDAVLIATDHSVYDYAKIVERARLVIDTRNATRSLTSSKIIRS